MQRLLKDVGQFEPISRFPTKYHDWFSYNCAAESFHTKKILRGNFFDRISVLFAKTVISRFELPLEGLMGNYTLRTELIEKLMVDFLL